MKLHLSGEAPDTSLAVVAENWYPGWTATVDGVPGRVLRVNHSLLGVAVPPGSGEIVLRFESPAYERGRLLSLVALLLVLGLIGILPRLRSGTSAHG